MGKSDDAKKEVYAIVTLNGDRIITGNPLALLAKDEEEQEMLTTTMAKALRANVVQLPNGDYLIFSAD